MKLTTSQKIYIQVSLAWFIFLELMTISIMLPVMDQIESFAQGLLIFIGLPGLLGQIITIGTVSFFIYVGDKE